MRKEGFNLPKTLLAENYKIKRVIASEQFMSVYVAERLNSEHRMPVIINEICDRSIINRCISGFSEIDKRKNAEFIECFSENSRLYAIFEYTAGKNIKKYIQSEKLNISYRIILFKSVLHKFLEYYHYPGIIRTSVINHENIVVVDNSVHFNFRIFYMGGDSKYTEEGVYIEIGNLLKIVFSPAELKSENKLQIIAEKCNKNIYKSVAEVIRDIEDAAGAIDKEKSLKTRMLEKKRKMHGLFMKAVAACMALVILYTAYDYYKKQTAQVFLHDNKDTFGSVNIKGNTNDNDEIENIVIEVNDTNKLNEADDKYSQPEQPEPEKVDLNMQKADESGNAPQGTVDVYIVSAGDTLYFICLEKYKDASYIDAVAKYNGIENSNLLYVGQTIKLPPAEELRSGEMANADTAAGTTGGAAQNPEAGLNFDEYVVLLEEEDYGQANTENQ